MKKILYGLLIIYLLGMAIIFIEWPTFVEDIIGNGNSASNISVTRDSLIGDGQLRVLLGNEYVFGCIIVALCILLALGFSRTTKEYVLCENTDYAAHPDTQRKPSVKMAYTDYLLTTVSAGIFLAWALLVKSPVEAFDVLMPSSDDGWIATTIGAFFICLPAGVFGMSAYYLWKTAYLSQKTQAYVCIAVMGIASLTWSLLMFMVYSPWLIWFAVGDSYLFAYLPFINTRREDDRRAEAKEREEAAEREARYRWSLEHPDAGDYGSGSSGSGGYSAPEPEDSTPRRPRHIVKSYEEIYEENKELWSAYNECYFYKDGYCHFHDCFHTNEHLESCQYEWNCTRCARFRRGGHQW